jgi:hypothetical protein
MASLAAAQRRGAVRAAAKRRRQTIFLIVLVAVLALLLAWELPHLLKGSGGGPTSPARAQAATLHPRSKLRHTRSGSDPFQRTPVPNNDARPVTRGGHDPFKNGPVPSHKQRVPGQFAPGKQFVIGRPGGHRVAHHGWIVILASIPTRNGHGSAVHFARRARANVGSLSILNSSNRRPLRGGYWVVYSGPDRTMSAVQHRASRIHAAGYGSAYVRELITYR